MAQTTLPTVQEREDTIPFLKRWSFRTNVVDWLLATPNIGVELDLSGSSRTRFSVLLHGKYNWNTHHSIAPRLVYNVAAGTVEGRKYWRTGGLMGNPMRRYTRENRDTTVSRLRWGFRRFRRNVLSGRTLADPRTWRAYYVGFYAGYEKYTISLGRDGKQGDSYNFGFAGGWSVPLYPFRDGRSVDLDLGLAVGAKLTAYDKFGYDEEFGCYVYQESKGRHFLPYPVIQDLHLSFVFRFRSIGKKVQDGEKLYDAWDTRQREKRNERERMLQDRLAERDSLYKARLQAREREKLRKDSLRQVRELADSLADATRQKEKEMRQEKKQDGNEQEAVGRRARRKGRKEEAAASAAVERKEEQSAGADGGDEVVAEKEDHASGRKEKRRQKKEARDDAGKETGV